ncbi:MAG: YihY/virulence factor BrkB family protein [Thermonemataceae bacterium]
MKTLKRYWILIKDTFLHFFESNAMHQGASIAFYTIFSLPGILIITINIGGYLYDEGTVETELYDQFEYLIGAKSAENIEKILSEAQASSADMQWVGILTLIFSATTVFAALQAALNNIWHVSSDNQRKGVVGFVLTRLLSFAMVVSLGFLLLVSLTLDTLLVFIHDLLATLFSETAYYFLNGINLGISLLIISVVFTLIFMILPDRKLRWRQVWKGGLVTSFLFFVGKFLIGFYIGQSAVGDAYGAAGSLVIILVWIYYSTCIVLLGSCFTYIYSKSLEKEEEKRIYAS